MACANMEQYQYEEHIDVDVGALEDEEAMAGSYQQFEQLPTDNPEEYKSPRKPYRMVNRAPAREHFCEICKKSFRYPSKISEHMRKHNGEKPFGCEICGQRFTQHHPLKVHMRQHLGERPYKCSYCTKSFPSQSGARTHEKTHVNPRKSDRVEEPQDTNIYACPVIGCGFVKENRTEVEVHIEVAHHGGWDMEESEIVTDPAELYQESVMTVPYEMTEESIEAYPYYEYDDGRGPVTDETVIVDGMAEEIPKPLDRPPEAFSSTEGMSDVVNEVVVGDANDDGQHHHAIPTTSTEMHYDPRYVKSEECNDGMVGMPIEGPSGEALEEEIIDNAVLQHEDVYIDGRYDEYQVDGAPPPTFEVEVETSTATNKMVVGPDGRMRERVRVKPARPHRWMESSAIEELDLDPAVLNDVLPRSMRPNAPPRRNRRRQQTPADSNAQSTARNLDWIIDAVAAGVDVDSASPHNRRKPQMHQCEFCGRIDKYPSKIEAHRRIHTGEKPFKCEICGAGFTQRTPMRMHMRRHLGERPFVCNIDGCQQRFISQAILNVHQNSKHFQKKRFVCMKGCGRVFASARNQKKHEDRCMSSIAMTNARMDIGEFGLAYQHNMHDEYPSEEEQEVYEEIHDSIGMYKIEDEHEHGGLLGPDEVDVISDDVIKRMEPDFI